MSKWAFPSLRGYDRPWLRDDIIAGLTVWAVLVPEALAYASIAGVSPVVGLYAAPPALILYAIFGSSRHLVTGPMAATAALSAAIVADVATQGSDEFVMATAALAICTGVLGLIAAALRLGFLANFISEPVLKGFIIGLALTIIAGQLPKLFGVEKGEGNFFELIWDLVGSLDETNGWTLAVGVVSIGIVVGLKEKLPTVPGSLIAVAFGIVAVSVFNLDDRDVSIVGQIDSGLPTIGVPDISADRYLDLFAGATGVLLIGFAEGLGAAKSYATRNHYEIDANRELLGLGAANVGAGLAAGMVVNGSLSKTAVNGGAGARTQLSGLVVAGLTVITLLFLTGLFENLPEATLAGVVIAALIELVDIPAVVRLYRDYTRRLGRIYGIAARADFLAAIAALFGVLLFDTLPGLFIGIGISFLLLLYRASRPHIAVLGRVPGGEQYADTRNHPENHQVPGVVVLRVEGGLFFGNADTVRDRIMQHAKANSAGVVVLDAGSIPDVDVTAARMLAQVREDLEQQGITLAIARDIGPVRDELRGGGASELLEHLFPTVHAAVEAAAEELGRAPRRNNTPSSDPARTTPGSAANREDRP